MICACSSGG